MNTWHISTFCHVDEDFVDIDRVMLTAEIVLVVNSETPPKQNFIEGLLGEIAPGLTPLMSEITLVTHVPNLNGR